MPRPSIGRVVRFSLLGLAVVLAAVAALSVAALLDSRQDYEDELARSYEAQVAVANLLAAGVIEETVLRSSPSARQREQAAEAYEQTAAAAQAAARGDGISERLLSRQIAAQRAARAARDTDGLATARRLSVLLAQRQEARRAGARDRAEARSRQALVTAGVAGGLALLAALGLVSFLVGQLRAPLERLVDASRRLAQGDLGARVPEEGPSELRTLARSFNAMAGDLERARAQVESERRRLALIVESLGDGLLVADAEGRIETTNPRAAELLPELRPGQLATSSALPPLERALHEEVVIGHDERSLAVTAARLGPGASDGVVWTVRDVSERARLEQLKSEFVATASHELRSPLTSIKGFVELLAISPGLPDGEREWAEIILLSTNRLVDLVNDLLDVTRVEAGRLEIHRRPMDIGEAVSEVAMMLRNRVTAKGQTLRTDVESELPAALADPSRVRQVLTNLVTNAHLYTGEGGTIEIRARADEHTIVLEVQDTGRGIPADELPRVFERFHRVRDFDSPGGTGLGLSIVKSLVELHGGTIDVESEVGRGTTFTVRFPRAPAASDLTAAREALRGKRVLIVDDEEGIARLIQAQLEPYEVSTAIAASGEEALRRLRIERFDAITLDILMPGISGFELLREVRADPELRGLPVVVVSVFSGREALAAEWVVSKPIEGDELADAVGAAILAGRTRLLVVARESVREQLLGPLGRMAVAFDWATSPGEAERLCAERRYEVALVDAGLADPAATLEALELRGRRLRRSVVLFSAGDDAPGIARMHPDPVPLQEAAQAVLAALGGPAAVG